ncbi:AAA family ATPase [Kitasatospora purpeofusca]|uniref:AAA family ATPase n=1 Tax=Kitasatospora purpeofusca TaxID=67352 RepID=UPI002A5A6E85|nr:AAA family ATPase [Kitasatospora purpeofusca]MDY0814914.1 AAA family ATPase [Kitasatospora purpeofusca]
MVTVLVNGLPGAGKTTLARALAAESDLPLLSKDAIKETLADTLAGLRTPECPDHEWSRILGTAAGETLWTLLGDAAAGTPTVTRASTATRPATTVWCAETAAGTDGRADRPVMGVCRSLRTGRRPAGPRRSAGETCEAAAVDPETILHRVGACPNSPCGISTTSWPVTTT